MQDKQAADLRSKFNFFSIYAAQWPKNEIQSNVSLREWVGSLRFVKSKEKAQDVWKQIAASE